MTDRWLILADDLTGAADCAIAFARRGVGAAVGWGASWAETDQPQVFAYDTGSRGLPAADAARRHGDRLAALHQPGRRLFKKIDSTLRGQPAAEIAAVSAHLAATAGATLGVLAPAFPATGRTTREGRVLVAGRPLEEAEVWRREHSYASADLAAICATAGLAAAVVPLATVRAGGAALGAALGAIAAAGAHVAVCDAETDEDLGGIAHAGLAIAAPSFFIGSAGLAHALAATGGAAPPVANALPPPTTRGALIVVGSLAAVSRAGARRLAKSGDVVHAPVTPELLLEDRAARAALGRRAAAALDAGQDVLVEIVVGDAPDLAIGPALVDALAEALAPAADRMGAFAATGGETAAALLSRFGVNGIRLLDELEPGVCYGLALGRLAVPVVTKAGAFGDDGTLTRIAARLRAARTHGVPS